MYNVYYMFCHTKLSLTKYHKTIKSKNIVVLIELYYFDKKKTEKYKKKEEKCMRIIMIVLNQTNNSIKHIILIELICPII